MKATDRLPTPTDEQFAAAADLALRDSFSRRPAQAEIGEAMLNLNSRLVDNAILYLSGNLQDQRDAVADTLMAVQAFLADQGISNLALVPVLRPVEALVERENNSLDPLFCERRRGGTPKRTLNKLVRIGTLAAIADAWLDAHADEGRTQDILLAEAVRALNGPWFTGVTRAQLKSARSLVSEEAPDHPSVIQAKQTRANIERAAEIFGARAAISIMVRYCNETPPYFAFGSKEISKTPHVSQSGDR